MEALLPTPTLPVLIGTCWNNKSCYLSLTIHGISYPKLVLYVIYFDLTTLFVPSSPGILFTLCELLGFRTVCHNSRRSTAFSLLSTLEPRVISATVKVAIPCSNENSPMLEQEQQVPFPLPQTSWSYRQYSTFLSAQEQEGVRVRRMPTQTLLECQRQAPHWATEGALRGRGPTQHCSILSRQGGVQPPPPPGWGQGHARRLPHARDT